MPDHNPQLVDRVARALYEVDAYSLDAPWDDDRNAVRHVYRKRARAALDAMPQPIGYTIVVNEDGELARDLDYWSDDLAANIKEAKTLDGYWTRPDRSHIRTHTVVALVPIEADHA